ncbi:hypothetical protein LEMLEM_LOCUS5765, partial [Lemmus lemmus]
QTRQPHRAFSLLPGQQWLPLQSCQRLQGSNPKDRTNSASCCGRTQSPAKRHRNRWWLPELLKETRLDK